MDPMDLARWTRFAAKGGIGKCTALVDCIAQEMGEDLMFLKDDEITVLMQLPEAGFYLGHCEGVVGRFAGKDVRFHGKLKRPVMAKRGSIGVPAAGGGSEGRASSAERSASVGGSSDAEREGAGSRGKDRKEKAYISADRITGTPTSISASSPSGSSARGTPSPMTRPYFQSTSTPLPGSAEPNTTGSSTSEKKTHAKAPGVSASISGSSVYSVSSEATSVYSTATSATYSTGSEETETQHGDTRVLSRSNTMQVSLSTSSVSTSAAFGSIPALPTSMSATTLTTSISEKSFTSESTYGSAESLGSVAKGTEFASDSKISDIMDTKFTLVPSLELSALSPGYNAQGSPSGSNTSSVAPLRLTKSPRTTPSPGVALSPKPTPVLSAVSNDLTAQDLRSLGGVIVPPSPGFSGARSPDVPGSLSPGSRSLGVPGSLSPGSRSPRSPLFPSSPSSSVFATQQSYASNPTSSSASTSPLPPMSPPPTSPLPAPPTISGYANASGSISTYSSSLLPPPGSPLPPSLPSPGSLPSPVFSVSGQSGGARGQEANSQKVNDLRNEYTNLRNERDAEGEDEEFEEGNTTRLSTLDALQRRLKDEDESSLMESSGRHDVEARPSLKGQNNGENGESENLDEADSDGEVGIGLSLMGAFGDDDDDDQDGVLGVDPKSYNGGNVGGKASNPSLGANGSEVAVGRITPISWTRYTPSSPIGVATSPETNGGHVVQPTIPKTEEVEVNGSREEDGSEPEDGEEEDDGAYWDDIYDDYRYSRYSLASKRFSVASKRISIVSKASATSKSSKSSRAPPVPLPTFSPDRPGASPDRPSFGSDRPSVGVYSRPSFDSTSTSTSTSTSHSRPPLERSISEESRSSTYSTHTLSPLSTQFPAVPTGVPVPVSVEPRLRVVNEGVVEGDEDAHGEKEMEVVHDSTENHFNGQDEQVVEVQVKSTHNPNGERSNGDGDKLVHQPMVNTAISPLLHTSFGSPHSSRAMSAYTETEDGSEQGHGYASRNSGKLPGSGKSLVDSLRSPVEEQKSPVEGGGMASVIRMRLESEHVEASSATVGPGPAKRGPGVGLGMEAIVVDDDEGQPRGVGADSMSSASTGAALTAHAITSPSSISDPAQPSIPTSLTAGRPINEQSSVRPRESNNSQLHPFSRTSIFLPHPNAPKAGFRSPGPMYGRPVNQNQFYSAPTGPGPGVSSSVPPNASAFSAQVVHHLRSISLAQGPARRPPMTLFARCQPDLCSSMGPVPIVFSLDPLPPLPPVNNGPVQGQGQGQAAIPSPPSVAPPTRAATVSVPARRSSMAPGALAALWNSHASVDTDADSAKIPAGNPKNAAKDASPESDGLPPLRLPRRSATTLTTPQEQTETSTNSPIPRAGFVPQVGTARPRSRSFSAFGAHVSNAPLPERSHEEPVTKTQDVLSHSSRSRNPIPAALMPRHVPSPLALQSSNLKDNPGTNITVVGSTSLSSPEQLKSPTSPVTRSPLNPPMSTSPALTSPPPVPSPVTAPEKEMEKNAPPVLGQSVPTGSSTSLSNVRSVTSPHPWVSTRNGSLDVPPRQNSLEGAAPRQSSDSGDSSITSPPPIVETFAQSSRSSPLAQEVPLRNKLSLPVLRGKASARQRVDDASSIASVPGSGENETVQVQDMDFELIKPAIPQVTGRVSQDSTRASREDGGKGDSPALTGDAGSIYSSAPRSPMVPTDTSSVNQGVESPTSADAHRQRELKWMALLPSIPPSQARKNKKVRRLLFEGVPSSVRYLVWCHLTDSKARALPELYTRLINRPRITAFAAIEQDAMKCFPDQPQLHTAQGPIASLLQAYLSMVPDVEYSSGLVSISGQLLLLAPEEDAFWIFTSVMDSHLRQHFSSNDMHIEIDATLFSNALESLDNSVHQKLYTALSINPRNITRPWFTTLFVGALPTEHLHRVWDIFLYEGVTWLFRVGLVICQCVRHLVLQATSEETALGYLFHPPLACLPSAAESFLQRVSTVKMKDDDIRKQRTKMETQLRQRPPHRVLSGGSGAQPFVISRPKP